ncbi:MAG TPA: hydrogenase maturation nickel metallochaperone HypA [Candidatus Cybelea sp.]
MHEASVARAIVDEIVDRASDELIERVFRVRLKIGALTGVFPDALTFVWDAATEGTLAEGSILEIERIPLEIFCKRCVRSRQVEQTHPPLPICPVCGDPSAEIVRGRELLITGLEVTYAAGTARSGASDSSEERGPRAGIA